MKTNDPILEARQIGKKINQLEIFTDLSFAVNSGDWLGIVGKNGSGKSTLASILVGIDRKYEGHIFFQNKNQKEVPLKEWVQNVQLISQYTRNALDPSKTIMKILKEPLNRFKIGSKESWENNILEILTACNLERELLTKKPFQLSGGQYQRVCIAQAMLLKPKLLICDEITANLDKINEIQIMKTLKKNKSLTVLFISHDRKLTEASCNRYLYMPNT